MKFTSIVALKTNDFIAMSYKVRDRKMVGRGRNPLKLFETAPFPR